MTNMVYKSVLCLLLMIQVKHGRWFFILDSPISIYFKTDASSLIEQPRANSLQMARFLAWGYLTTGFFTAKFGVSFEADLPVWFLLIPSLLPVFFLFFFFSFPFYFWCSYPRGVYKRNRNYNFFPGEIDNKIWEINLKHKMLCGYR